jgi:hypothetical protein
MIRDSNCPELESAESLAEFVRTWEQCLVPAEEWTHAAHIAMAAHYLQTLPKDEALSTVRKGIFTYAKSRGVPNERLGRGYHETLTVFWVELCERYLRSCGKQGIEAARAVVDHYGNQSKLHKEYYSGDVVMSAEAKAGWVAPDLRTLP